jgi:preprotein translocase subunit SecB
METTQNPTASATPPSPPRFVVKGQYIKDLSFENPHAPGSLLAFKDKPNLEVSVDLKAQKIKDDLYELVMLLSARASHDSNTLFLVELAYSGIFQLINVPEEHVEPLLLVDAPFVLFPFARRVVSDVSRDGGFPPLMLEPIDFHSLYRQNKEAVKKSA